MFSAGESDPKGLPETQSQPAQPSEEVATIDADPWTEAEAAYNAEPDTTDIPNLVDELPETRQGAEGTELEGEQPAENDKKAPLPPGEEEAVAYKGVDLWNPEGLETPEQVKERLAQIQTYLGDKTKEWKGQLDNTTQAHQALSQLVAQAASDPQKIPMLLRYYQNDLEQAGIPVNVEGLTQLFGQPQNPAEEAVNTAEKEQEEFITNAKDYILKAESEEDMGERIARITLQARQDARKEIRDLVPELKKSLLEEMQHEIGPIKSERVQMQRRDSWNNAIDEVAAQPGMEGIKEAVQPRKGLDGNPLVGEDGNIDVPIWNFIRQEPVLKQWVQALNVDPKGAAARGVTHASILKTAYKLYSEQDRIKSATEKARADALGARKAAGETPGHNLSTIPAEGMDWNEIEKEIGDPFITS